MKKTLLIVFIALLVGGAEIVYLEHRMLVQEANMKFLTSGVGGMADALLAVSEDVVKNRRMIIHVKE